jgi:hypothetical protein
MVYRIYKINPENDAWISDLTDYLSRLRKERVRIYIRADRKYEEITVMENIFEEENVLNVKFLGNYELIIRAEPEICQHHVPLIVNLIQQYLTNGIAKTVQYLTEKLLNDTAAPPTKIEFLI